MPELKIEVNSGETVSGILLTPKPATACYVVAHGAGAGMEHPFMAAVAEGLFERQIATLRYQFPYMEKGSKRPDRPDLAQATVRAAVASASGHLGSLPLFAGGKSFGGRMTSQAQAQHPLPSVQGLVFLGFPLHAAGKPSADRAAHLKQIRVPMLFLQGSRDTLADLSLMRPAIAALGSSAELMVFEAADHSFHVPVRSGKTDAQIMASLLDALAAWIGKASQ